MKWSKPIVAALWCVCALGAIAADETWEDWFEVAGTIESEVTPPVDAPATNTLTKVEISFASGAMDVADFDAPSGAQTAFAPAYDGGETNYYAYVDSAWTKLNGAPTPVDENVALTVTFNYAVSPAKVQFSIGDWTSAWLDTGVAKSQVESVAFTGSGTVNSVDADVARADATAANGISYAASYALNLDPTNLDAGLKTEPVANPTVVSGNDVKVKVSVPVTPRKGYTVKYQVMKLNGTDWVEEGEAQSDPAAILVPAASGRYRVDAVITK